MVMIARTHPEQIRRTLEGISLLIRGDIARPASPFEVHPISKITEAFQDLNSEKHFGQTVFTISEDDIVEVSHGYLRCLIGSTNSILVYNQKKPRLLI